MLSGQYPEPVREQDGQLLGRLSPVLHWLPPLLPDSRKCEIPIFPSLERKPHGWDISGPAVQENTNGDLKSWASES